MQDRVEFLPGLMEFVNMSLIPVNYFMNHIENEEILKSHCQSNIHLNTNHYNLLVKMFNECNNNLGVLYDALKMYTFNFYSGCQMPFNQVNNYYCCVYF